MDKKERLNEIKALIESFSKKYLSDELKGYVINLCDRLGRKRTISITRGKPEIWAASIVYVIARLNFLFDIENPNHITADIICEFFNTKKSTTGNKATQIEKDCNVRLGGEGLCSPHISDMFTFVQTPEGFILPKSYFSKHDRIDEKDTAEREAQIEEQRQQKKLETEERRRQQVERQRQIAEEKRKKKHKNQGNLFG
ncbi:hypothetical protein H8E88_17780 [candidate division KSB1 bacterium]|nr:hypothetical protein [candidate division KSB1 bacterium]